MICSESIEHRPNPKRGLATASGEFDRDRVHHPIGGRVPAHRLDSSSPQFIRRAIGVVRYLS